MAQQTTRQSTSTVTLKTKLDAMRGTWLGAILHPQGHRAVVYLGDAGSGLQFWSVDPPNLLEMLDVPRADTARTDGPSEKQLPIAWRFNRGEAAADVFPVTALTASQRGDHVAASAGPLIQFHRLSTDDAHLNHLHTWESPGAAVVHLALSSDGSSLFCSDRDDELRILRTSDGQVVHDLGPTPGPLVLRFIWQDQLAAVGDEMGRVTCWNARNGKRHLQFQAHHGGVRDIAFNPRRRTLLTCGDDGFARIWNLEAGTQVGKDIRAQAPLLAGRFMEKGQLLAVLDRRRHLLFADASNGDLLDGYRHPRRVWGFDVAPSRGLISLVGEEGISILSVDVTELASRRRNARQTRSVEAVADQSQRITPPSVPATHSAKKGDAPIGAVMSPDASGLYESSRVAQQTPSVARRRVASGSQPAVGQGAISNQSSSNIFRAAGQTTQDSFFDSLGEDPLDSSNSQISASGLLDPPEGMDFELDYEAAKAGDPDAIAGAAGRDRNSADIGVVGADAESGGEGRPERLEGRSRGAGEQRSTRGRHGSRATSATSSGNYQAVPYRRFEGEGPRQTRGVPLPLIIGLSILLAVLVSGAFYWLTLSSESSPWATELASMEEERTTELAGIEAEFEAFEQRQYERLEDNQARASLDSERRRMERVTSRIVSDQREEVDAQIAVIDEQYAQRMRALRREREEAATTRATTTGFATLIGVFLLGFFTDRAIRRREESA